jgi:hypothetical protein
MKRRKIFFSLLLLFSLAITTLTISEMGFAQGNAEPLAGEGVLQCEYHLHKPMVALILTRTMQSHVGLGSMYHDALREIVEYSFQQGVIPVLSTSPYWGPIHPSTDVMNATIRAVANEYQVPLWDLYLTTETLPERGIDPDNTYHTTKPDDGKVTYFIYKDDHMDAGMTRRNLEALEVLNAIVNAVE